MTLYQEYFTKKAICYMPLATWGGLEILDILYGIEDYVIACFNWGADRHEIRRHKINHTPDGRAFIRKEGRRYYLDDMMQV